MGISPLSTTSSATQTGATASKSSDNSSGSTTSASGSKKDSVLISQKAKDLAALQAGQSSQEDLTESVAAKQAEGDNS